MGGKTTTQTATMDPIQEQFITEKLLPFADKIVDTPFQPYTGDRVAGLTQIQKDALGGYGALSLPSEIGEATEIYRNMANRSPEAREQDIASYTQAYTSNVIDPTIAAMERQRAKQRVGEEADIIRSKAFGGDRRAIMEGERQGEYEAQMGKTLGELQARGYQSAVQRANLEDQARMRAAGALSGSGIQGLKAQQNILGAQMTAGDTERQLQQQQLDADFNQYLAEMQYPLTQFGVLTGAGQAFPAGIGTTVGRERDPMGSFGRVLSGLGSFGMGGGMRMFS